MMHTTQNFSKVNMAAITEGRSSFVDFESDVNILFSKWPIELNCTEDVKLPFKQPLF